MGENICLIVLHSSNFFLFNFLKRDERLLIKKLIENKALLSEKIAIIGLLRKMSLN